MRKDSLNRRNSMIDEWQPGYLVENWEPGYIVDNVFGPTDPNRTSLSVRAETPIGPVEVKAETDTKLVADVVGGVGIGAGVLGLAGLILGGPKWAVIGALAGAAIGGGTGALKYSSESQQSEPDIVDTYIPPGSEIYRNYNNALREHIKGPYRERAYYGV